MSQPQGEVFVIVIIFYTLLFGGVIFFILFETKKRGGALKRLAEAIGGVVSRFSFFPKLKGVFNGRNFLLTLAWGGKHTPPYLNLHLFKDSYYKLTIYQESLLSQMGQKLGIVREVKTTDSAFDAEFLIFSDKPDQALRCLYDQAVKEAVRGLFRQGFDLIACDGKKITIRKPHYRTEYDLEPGTFKKFLEKIDLLAQRL